MTETKFTPGPWVWRSFGDQLMLVTAGNGAKVILSPHGETHIQTRDAKTGILRAIRAADASARLIAAAPDMLAALKSVVAIADRRTDEFDAARTAIAKAEDRHD